MEEELAIAREIQSSLLPQSLPSDGWFRAAGSSIPSHAVGGDCFDVRQTAPDAWTAVLMDVSGKGVSSALLAALLQGSFLTAMVTPHDMQATMARINQFLYERTEGEKYATVFLCVVGRNGSMWWSNAGHVKPLLVRASGEVTALDTTGMPLGILDVGTFGVETTTLSPGDKLVVYSDGLTEAQDPTGDFFETGRLRALLVGNATRNASDMNAAIMREVEDFTAGAVQTDDITCLVIEYRPE
jgi:serine phosphatase RsbU (regulator of sigma subunit)